MNERDDNRVAGRLRREGVRFTISIAAEMVNVHAQTLRHYERIGLISPKRSEGRIRYYTLDDIEKLDMIKNLIEKRKVNLAGVEAILEMQQQIDEMRDEMEQHIDELRTGYETEIARLKGIIRRMNGQDSVPTQDAVPLQV